MKDNMITTAPYNRVILTIALPLMINNFIRTLYNLTDGLYVAQLSAEDFAATAFIWPLNFLFIAIGLGVGIGATSLIAQYIGAKDAQRARRFASNGVLLCIGLGFMLSLIGYLGASQMVSLMGASDTFHLKATAYLKINFIGLFFDFCYFGYQALLNAQGRTRTITIISTVSAVVNVVLDPLFIFTTVPLVHLPGLGWGIDGAAWATVIAKVVLFICVVIAVKRESRIQVPLDQLRVDRPVMRRILRIALPSAVGYGGAALGFTVLNGVIQGYGTSTLAAYSMVNRITDLLTQPQMGIGGALPAIIGQHIGAKLFDRAKRIFTRAMVWIVAISAICSILTVMFRQPILSVFITNGADEQLWRDAVDYLNYSAVIIFFMGLFSGYTGFFQGCGETRYAMQMSIGRLWLVRLPVIWLLSAYTDLGATGIWIAMLLSNALTVLYGHLIYRHKNWEQWREK